jgi:hypothetical protein
VALAVDASTPARVDKPGTGATAATTATFDPPAGLLVVCCAGDGTAQTFTITNNGSALTWTEIGLRNSSDVGGQSSTAQAFYSVLTAGRTGMTVTATYTQANDTSFKVYVLTGADAADPLGGTSEGSTTSASFTTASFTTESANSLGFVALCDFDATGSASATGTTMDAGTIAGQISFASGYKTLGSAGSSASFDVTMPGAPTLNYVTFEIEADAGGQTVSPSSITSGEAFGTAVVTPGAVTVSPPAVDSGEVFGTAVLTVGAVTVSPSSVASDEAFGTATVTPGAVTVSPDGVASGEAFGTAVVTPGAVTVSPVGIDSAEALGVPVVTTPGAQTVSPSSITSGEAFGTAEVGGGAVAVPVGSWWGLVSIVHEAREMFREDRERDPVACPNDGEPLERGPDGRLHCAYDGYRWPR